MTTHQFPNIYWTGCWTNAWSEFADYDVIWGIGGDCSLKAEPQAYLQAIESAYPFGLWSPTISGRAHEYMQPTLSGGRIFSVAYLEGMALAISKQLWGAVNPLDNQDYIGYSHDRRLSFSSRRQNLKNVLDGRVELHHPPSENYNKEEARGLMEEALERAFGPEWGDVLDWWPHRRLSFMANACSQIVIKEDGEKIFGAPFHRK